LKVLVTGGTGFVGLAVAEALRSRSHDVILFGAASLPVAFARHRVIGSCRMIEGDIRSPSDVAATLDESVDAVIHGAGVTPSAVEEATRPADVLGVNLQGTLELLTRAMSVGVRRVVILSSVAAYGHARAFGEAMLREDTCPIPTTLYGISKLAAEQVSFRMGELWSLDVRAVRLGPVVGPWEYSAGFRSLSAHCQALDQALAGQECVLEREMRGDFLYSRDAGRAIVQLTEARHIARRLYNLGGAVSSVADWCRALAERIPGFRWRFDPASPTIHPWLEYDRAVLDSGAFSQEFGLALTPLDAGAVDDYIAWRREGM
jgi:nucleoside-diphosphate-sugar epimerase